MTLRVEREAAKRFHHRIVTVLYLLLFEFCAVQVGCVDLVPVFLSI
jgi:hypothetical protein